MSELDIRAVERSAVEYLSAQLGDRAPRFLSLEAEFDESPLEGEGATALFAFELETGEPCTRAPAKHYVAAGMTTPNFFPAYGLSADDAYSFHLGTRFMLELELRLVDESLEPPGARQHLRALIAQRAAGAPLGDETLAALFKCDDAYYAIYRLRIGDDEFYAMGADCPAGFYRMTAHPPQAALRLHLGKLIRAEARAAQASGPADAPGTTKRLT